MADFTDDYDDKRECCWIAERNETFLGCIMLAKRSTRSDTAKLRLFLVEPAARGLGVGKTLVRTCIAFGKEAGYQRVVWWTQDHLVAARKLYQAAGFIRVEEEGPSVPQFYTGASSENWELEFASSDERL